MQRIVLAGLAITALACSSAIRTESGSEIWKVHLVTEHGTRLGMVRIQVTDEITSSSCIATPFLQTRRGVVLEVDGLDDGAPIGDEAAVFIDDQHFWMDLNLGWCDHNGCLEGATNGRRASGEYSHGTAVGYLTLGKFHARRE